GGRRGRSGRREVAREHSDADSEAPERILKASRLACEENAALAGCFRHQHVSRAAESHRVSHREASAFAEELDGPFEVNLLAVKVLEQAGRHGAPAAGNQEIGITFRGQKIRKHSVRSIGAGRFEVVPDCDRVGGSGAAGDDAAFRQPRPGLAEADLDASGEGLALQRLVESARARASRDEIKKRLARPVAVLASLRIEKSPFPNGTGSRVRINPDRGELVQSVRGCRPILDSLQVAVKTPTDFGTLLVDDRPTSRTRHRERRSEPRWPGPNDVDNPSPACL